MQMLLPTLTSGEAWQCAVALGTATDFVVRFQRNVAGEYRLGVWNGTTWNQVTGCTIVGTSGTSVAGAMNFGAAVWGSGLPGKVAYLRLYSTAESYPFAAPPNAIVGSSALLNYEFEDNLADVVNGVNFQMFPMNSTTPKTPVFVTTP